MVCRRWYRPWYRRRRTSSWAQYTRGCAFQRIKVPSLDIICHHTDALHLGLGTPEVVRRDRVGAQLIARDLRRRLEDEGEERAPRATEPTPPPPPAVGDRPSTRRPRAVRGTAMLRLLHWSASRSPRRRAARRGSGPGRAGTSPRSSGPRRTRSGSASRRPRQRTRSKRAETPANSKTFNSSRNSPPGRHTYKQQREPGRCV